MSPSAGPQAQVPRRLLGALWLSAALFSAACASDVPHSTVDTEPLPKTDVEDADDTRQTRDAEPAAADDLGPDTERATPAQYPMDETPPTLVLSAPAEGESVTTATIVISGQVSDDVGLTTLLAQVGPQVPVPIAVPAAGGAFSAELPLIPGPQTLVVAATDVGGNQTAIAVQIERVVDLDDTTPPNLVVSAPQEGFSVFGDTVWSAGLADDDQGVVSLTVQVDEAPPLAVETADAYATWSLAIPLSASSAQTLRFRASDLAGNATEITLLGGTSMAADTEPPTVTFTAPAPGTSVEGPLVLVSGTANDNVAIAAVDLRVDNGAYLPTETSDGYANWRREVSLAPGDNVLTVRATDSAGLTKTRTIEVYEPSIDAWGPPVTLTLHWTEAPHTEATFQLDRAGVEALIVPSVAEEIVMMELELEPLIISAIDLVRVACGEDWKGGIDPAESCPETWGQPEINLWRLVTMTPLNADVVGTSVEGMQEMSDAMSEWGLTDSFADILSSALNIPVDGLFLTDDAVAQALSTHVVESHPNVLPGGRVPVTLQDVLSNMATFGPRFGPAGDHPGFLVPTKPPFAEVLTEDFLMFMATTSNIHWHDGVRLGTGKGYLALLDDTTGPTYDDVLEFDFLNPDTFWVNGVADDPKAVLTLQAFEHDGWVAVGDAMEPQPRGNSEAWSLDPWLLEAVMAEAAYQTYKDHRAGCDLCSGSEEGALLYEVPLIGLDEAEIVVGRAGYDKDGDGEAEHFPFISPNPAGWFRSWTLFGVGAPPQPQYVWDMILEIAERRLLDGGVEEGAGDVTFELQGVSVGMSSEELKAAVRPNLEAQKSELSALLIGDYSANGDPVDFYLTRGETGALSLTFVAPSDPVPSGTAEHTKPGFFADPQLVEKVSTLDEDLIHERLALTTAPQLVYSQDTEGTIYQIATSALGEASVTLSIRAWVGPSEGP